MFEELTKDRVATRQFDGPGIDRKDDGVRLIDGPQRTAEDTFEFLKVVRLMSKADAFCSEPAGRFLSEMQNHKCKKIFDAEGLRFPRHFDSNQVTIFLNC